MNWLVNSPRMVTCFVKQKSNTPAKIFVENSLNGHIAVITGGNGGIGYETALSLATQGCEVYSCCRNMASAEEKAKTINDKCMEINSQGKVIPVKLDLADLVSVNECIAQLRTLLEGKTINYFICNGGIMMVPYSKSPQGYELQFATNHLGHFALVGGMIDMLIQSKSKVVVITGDIAVLANDASPNFVYNDDGLQAYCRSKICNQSFAIELFRRYGRDLQVFCVHPGVINSNLVAPATEGVKGYFEGMLRRNYFIDCEMGSRSTLYCILTDKVPNGAYFHNCLGVTAYHSTASNLHWSEGMWELSVKLCKVADVPLRY